MRGPESRGKEILWWLPPTHVDAAVDDLPLELDDVGILQLVTNSHLKLTPAGLDEYKPTAAHMELKQKAASRSKHDALKL